MPDPDLEIRGGGAGGRGGGSSRPLDKRGPGLQKKFFRSFGPQFDLQLSGGGPSPGPGTGICLPSITSEVASNKNEF